MCKENKCFNFSFLGGLLCFYRVVGCQGERILPHFRNLAAEGLGFGSFSKCSEQPVFEGFWGERQQKIYFYCNLSPAVSIIGVECLFFEVPGFDKISLLAVNC